jgi:hypothetical protein
MMNVSRAEKYRSPMTAFTDRSTILRTPGSHLPFLESRSVAFGQFTRRICA